MVVVVGLEVMARMVGNNRHRRARIWEFEANEKLLRTWKRVEYIKEKFDELLLLRDGDLVIPSTYED